MHIINKQKINIHIHRKLLRVHLKIKEFSKMNDDPTEVVIVYHPFINGNIVHYSEIQIQ